MARHEGDFHAAAGKPLSLEELLDLLSAEGHCDSRTRQDAIACYLAGGEGWRDALKQLGGAFAERGAQLRERKTD